MAPESTTFNDGDHHNNKHKHLDQEVKELISALTNRLGSIQRSQKSGSSSTHNQDEDDQGVRIITLAGSNVGATMRGETDQKPQDQPLPTDQDDFATYVNSNFQAINNSIMLGGSYKTKDPGVHLDISDYYEKKDKLPKKGAKNKRSSGSSKSDHHAEHEDKSTSTSGSDEN